MVKIDATVPVLRKETGVVVQVQIEVESTNPAQAAKQLKAAAKELGCELES